jgi:hypothetical protein
MACARCGGAHGPRWEQVHIDDETNAKLLAHADELERLGITLEEQQPLAKFSDHAIGVMSLVLAVAESLRPGTFRGIVLFLRDLAIPEEQILRLRLDEPENISRLLGKPLKKMKPKSSSRKRATKHDKKR